MAKRPLCMFGPGELRWKDGQPSRAKQRFLVFGIKCMSSHEQFRNVDEKWFDSLNFNFVKNWLYQIIDSEDFLSIMKKYKLWEPNQKPICTNFFS